MTFELVLDNSELLANCFDEAPLEPIVMDLGGWDATDPSGAGAFDELGTMDTSSALTWGHGQRYAPEYFGLTNTGTAPSNVNIYMPATPAGYVLADAKYVVIAQRSAIGGSAGPGWTGYNPAPTTSPFLHCESSGVTDGTSLSDFVFNDIPVGSFGEVVCPQSELLSRLTAAPGAQVPANRLWVEDWVTGVGVGSRTITVAYFGIRLTYNPV